MLVRWLFPIVSTARSGECQHSFFPGLKKCTPRQKVREPTGCVLVQGRLKQVCPDGLAVTGFWAGNALYLPRQGQSPSCWTFRFTQGHDQRVPGYGGEDLQNDTKSKDKGKRPNQGRIAKRITPPEETRQRPPDHQARRRSRKETLTLTQVAQNGMGASDCPARRRH